MTNDKEAGARACQCWRPAAARATGCRRRLLSASRRTLGPLCPMAQLRLLPAAHCPEREAWECCPHAPAANLWQLQHLTSQGSSQGGGLALLLGCMPMFCAYRGVDAGPCLSGAWPRALPWRCAAGSPWPATAAARPRLHARPATPAGARSCLQPPPPVFRASQTVTVPRTCSSRTASYAQEKEAPPPTFGGACAGERATCGGGSCARTRRSLSCSCVSGCLLVMLTCVYLTGS